MIKRTGFLWSSFGLTKLHLLGLTIAGGVFTGVGVLFLIAALNQYFAEAAYADVAVRLAFAAVSFLAAITVALASLLSVHFYHTADRLGLLDRADSVEPGIR